MFFYLEICSPMTCILLLPLGWRNLITPSSFPCYSIPILSEMNLFDILFIVCLWTSLDLASHLKLPQTHQHHHSSFLYKGNIDSLRSIGWIECIEFCSIGTAWIEFLPSESLFGLKFFYQSHGTGAVSDMAMKKAIMVSLMR